MSFPNTNDELAAIERSAQGAASKQPSTKPAAKGGRRRGSSTMVPGVDYKAQMAQMMSKEGDKQGLLEPFPPGGSASPMSISGGVTTSTTTTTTSIPKINPTSVAASGSSNGPPPHGPPPSGSGGPPTYAGEKGGGPKGQRGSVVMKPMPGIGGLIDFDDSDFDDSDDEDLGRGSHQLPGAPMPGASNVSGTLNSRPMVGGFAAAAYEAAKAHHFANLNKGKKVEVPKRTGPPPSI